MDCTLNGLASRPPDRISVATRCNWAASVLAG